jgi:hypothetical protein
MDHSFTQRFLLPFFETGVLVTKVLWPRITRRCRHSRCTYDMKMLIKLKPSNRGWLIGRLTSLTWTISKHRFLLHHVLMICERTPQNSIVSGQIRAHTSIQAAQPPAAEYSL